MSRRTARRTAAVGAALSVTVALAGCGLLDEGGDAGGGDGEVVRVGYLHTIAVDDKLHYGLAEGYWEDEGISIEATEFDTGIAVSQALTSGDIDVAIMGGVTSNFPAQGQGQIFMINSVETATARLWVQEDSGIETVADLEGRSLTTTEGTTADVYLNAAFEEAGLDREDVDVVNAAMPNAVQAFVSDSVDAIALWVPFDLRVEEGDTGAVEIDDAGSYPDASVADGWIANNAWYDENRDGLAKDLVRGWLRTNAAYREDPEGALETVHAEAYDGQAELSDLQYQVDFQEDYTNEEWVELYENGDLLDIVGTAEQAFVDLGGVPEYVEPEEFFDTELFVETYEESQE